MVSKDINKIECEKAFMKIQLNSVYGTIGGMSIYRTYQSYNRRIRIIRTIGKVYE